MSFMTFSLSEVLAGSTTLFLVTKLFKWIEGWRNSKVDLAQNMRDIQEIHMVMEELVKETSYERITIFYAEDSAGIIAPGKIMYITAIYEKTHQNDDNQIRSIIKSIQRWESDTPYYGMISDVISRGHIELITENMPNSNLKDLYKSDNIKYSNVFHLLTTKNKSKVYYCSVVTRATINPHVDDRVYLTSAISKIKDLFKRNSKYL